MLIEFKKTLSCCLAGLVFCAHAYASELSYELRYQVDLKQSPGDALVRIEIPDAKLLKELDFKLNATRHLDLRANGRLAIDNGRAQWFPPSEHAQLSLRVPITHKRDDDSYDALWTEDWALFRGDDLVPTVRVVSEDGAFAQATLNFVLPEHWEVNTGWERLDKNEFKIDKPERRFDRPVGWMIAGKIGTRRDEISGTQIAVSAPKGQRIERMSNLSFLHALWPEFKQVFETLPPELLIVSADDPMWRGGLSAPNSLYLHADRPVVSENGTSTLVHELVHVVTGLRGKANSDWIVEGIAEFYSVELQFRAGTMNAERRQKTMDSLKKWSRDVKTLAHSRSHGAITARAVLLFDELSRELSTNGKSIDELTRKLVETKKVSLEGLKKDCQSLLAKPCQTLEENKTLFVPPTKGER